MSHTLLLFLLLIIPFSHSSTNCTSTCGPHKVPYPFGFSPSCPISLTCAEPQVLLKNLRVHNISSNGTLLLELPTLCNRPLFPSLSSLFSSNFALTRKNALLLRNCTYASTCVIPTSLLSDRLDLQNCGPRSDNITCVADPDSFASPAKVATIRCGFLFGSVRYEMEYGNVTELVFSVLELGWWVQGEECRCLPNAECIKVKPPAGGPGFRCLCRDGFEGSGFADDRSDERGCYKGA